MTVPITRTTNRLIEQNTSDIIKIRPKTLNPSCPSHQSGSFRPQPPLPCFTVSVPVAKPHAQPHRLWTPRPFPINHYWKQTLMHASAAVQTSPPLRSLLNAMASNNASSQSSLTVLLTQPACLLPVSPASYVAGLTLSSADKGLALKCVWFSTSQHCPRQTLAPHPTPATLGS